MKLLYLLACLWLTACSTSKPPSIVVRPIPSEADVADVVRFPEVVRAYQAGRYTDQSSVLHEQHRVYRIEAGSRWNFRPPPENATPLVALEPPPDGALAPLPLNDALRAELNRQKDVTESVAFQATQLTAAFEQLQAVLQEMRASARAQAFLSSHVGEMEKRLEALELHKLSDVPAPKTEMPESPSRENPLLGR